MFSKVVIFLVCCFYSPWVPFPLFECCFYFVFFCCCILRMHFPFSPSSCRLNPFTSSFSSASSKCWLLKLSLTFQFLPPPQHSIILIHCGSKLSTLVQSHIPLRFWFYFGMFYIAPVNNPKSIIYKSPIYNNQTKKAWSEKRERERGSEREKEQKYMSTANRVEKFVGRSCPNGKVDADKWKRIKTKKIVLH